MPDVPGPELFENHVERLLRQARERGEFDNLTGSGKPLPPDWYADTSENWWIHRKIADEGLSSDAMLPPEVLLRRERRAIQDTLASVTDEEHARTIVRDLAARIAQSNRDQRGTRMPLVAPLPLESTIAQWRQRRTAGDT